MEPAMRCVKGHGLQTRSRIVENASYGLRQNGADGVSVAGGFYSHFDSREALVIEAFAQAMDRTVADWLKIMKGMPAEERFDAVVEAYLSPRHRDNRARGCVLPALGADIARSGQKAGRMFAGKFEQMIGMVARLFPEKSPKEARQVATSALATMMGSIVLARAAGEKTLSDDILEAGRQALRSHSAARRSSR
jgi:TetR/AcrR family transcriptional repressor of nem operon